VLRASLLLVLCASCSAIATAPSSLRTLEVPLPVTNDDQLLLEVHYTTGRSDEFRAFYRAFYEWFPIVYQHRCSESHCFTEPQWITLEELSDTARGYKIVSVSIYDSKQEPTPVGHFILERGRNSRLSAHSAAIWTIKYLLRTTSLQGG
jgi:hypothetical protein